MTTTRTDGPSASAARHQTTYSTPSDRELVITRTFDAPRSLLWEVFTDPKHLPNWYAGLEGFTMPVCEIDLRPGGTWRYGWRNAQGREFTASGTYREVDPPKRVVQTANANGEQTITTTFTEESGRTTVTVTQLFASQAVRDQGLPYAKMGTEPNYARLDTYLASMS